MKKCTDLSMYFTVIVCPHLHEINVNLYKLSYLCLSRRITNGFSEYKPYAFFYF